MAIDVRQLDLGSVFEPADYKAALEQVLRDPATRYRLRERIREDASADPIDAVTDAFVLLELAKLRLQQAMQADDHVVDIDEVTAQAIDRAKRGA
jgi:mannose/cellobiose epimerase-like protein (N-acyl-D-glucosamine 2-epimerase family)